MTREEKKIQVLLMEIRTIAKELPAGKYRKVSNRCDKINSVIKRAF